MIHHKRACCSDTGHGMKKDAGQADAAAARLMDGDTLSEYAERLDKQQLNDQTHFVQTQGRQEGLHKASLSGILGQTEIL